MFQDTSSASSFSAPSCWQTELNRITFHHGKYRVLKHHLVLQNQIFLNLRHKAKYFDRAFVSTEDNIELHTNYYILSRKSNYFINILCSVHITMISWPEIGDFGFHLPPLFLADFSPRNHRQEITGKKSPVWITNYMQIMSTDLCEIATHKCLI